MDKIRIVGGVPLVGEITASGAKNATLPEMAAALLTDEEVVLEGIPDVRDVATMEQLLAHIGVETGRTHRHELVLRTRTVRAPEAPYDLVKTMRAAVLVLGPLVARHGRARVSLPGGCAIGARPINLHLKALAELGARVSVDHGYVVAEAERLHGAHIRFEQPTVTGTENAMMAAVLAEGESVLENAALEPEIEDLALMLRHMGAHLEGAGTPVIRIQGVERLGGVRHEVVADRIEVGTFLVAAAIAGGEVMVRGGRAEHLGPLLAKLAECGCSLDVEKGGIRIGSDRKLRSTDVRTAPFPGFPTDMQAQFVALMTQAAGISVVTETLFENRFMHVAELRRLGAQIRIDDASVIIKGRTPLEGATVMATDLRASASLLLAGLVAEGETVVERVYHIDRGYERIEEKLRLLGARIERDTGRDPERETERAEEA